MIFVMLIWSKYLKGLNASEEEMKGLLGLNMVKYILYLKN